MEALKEIWSSIRLSALDRLGNPLVGAFALAWVVWNFRLVLVAFGAGEWRAKIDYIDKVLMVSWTDWLLHGYAVPLSVAVVWVFILPLVFRRVLVFHRAQAAETARAVLIAEGKQPLTEEEASRLRLRMRDLGDRWDKERAAYLRQNEELSQQIAELQVRTNDSPQAPPPTEAEAASPPLPDATDVKPAEAETGPDWLVEAIGSTKLKDGETDLWPLTLRTPDLGQLPRSVSSKVDGQAFERIDIQALLAMRNWSTIKHNKLAQTLGVEDFDAKVIVDKLRTMGLVDRGIEGDYLNPDGRMLTAFFKRIFANALEGKRPASSGTARVDA